MVGRAIIIVGCMVLHLSGSVEIIASSSFAVVFFLVLKLGSYLKILFPRSRSKTPGQHAINMSIIFLEITYNTWRKFATRSYSGSIFVKQEGRWQE